MQDNLFGAMCLGFLVMGGVIVLLFGLVLKLVDAQNSRPATIVVTGGPLPNTGSGCGAVLSLVLLLVGALALLGMLAH